MFENFKIKKQYHCLICFKNLLEGINFQSLAFFHPYLCQQCFSQFKIANLTFSILNCPIKILYYYNDFLKTLFFQYKGCYDIELAPIFLNYHLKQLKKEFKDYVIVYPPSNDLEVKKRKFQHIKELAKPLCLPIYDVFYKTKDYKQSKMPFRFKKEIFSIIAFKKNKNLENKKILLIDDIFTSGNTIQACILLLQKNISKIKDLKILCICKTEKKVEL